jgi:hypothetical protein
MPETLMSHDTVPIKAKIARDRRKEPVAWDSRWWGSSGEWRTAWRRRYSCWIRRKSKKIRPNFKQKTARGDEQHEEEGVRAASDENQKTIRPNLNRKTARGDEQHEEEGVRAASDENQKTIQPNLNRK